MITQVAIRFKGVIYSLLPPNRHHDVIRYIASTIDVDYVGAHGDDQGFLDYTGRYLTRKQALIVARKAGQIKDESKVVQGMLFSENVW